ncbi:hypothetical protein AB5J56_36985 [Streptomyces sp. R21]|uniref:Uncharacterized protein n=1 Tax=Streptomyces sp. R21 TaxID=3238627 RepID=A0AB39PJB9_9ACTN
MSAGVSMASGKGEIVQLVLPFLPDWMQHVVLVLLILAVLATWGFKIRRKLDHRRALREGRPLRGQGRGADYLGAYAPEPGAVPPPSRASPMRPDGGPTAS